MSKVKRRFTNDLGEVRMCGCGGVHLVIGPMTLHFAADEVDALADLVAGARDLRDGARQSTRSADDGDDTVGKGRIAVNRPMH